VPVADEPATPEGRLIRRYRLRQSPELPIPKLAARLGWSKEKQGAIERGRTTRQPAYPISDDDLARIAVEIAIPAAELERIGRAEAAEILRGTPGAVPEPAAAPDPATLAAVDELFAALIKDRPDRNVLEFLWRGQDGDGNPKPLAERVRSVADWAADGQRDADADGSRLTG
jgi:hypothetical protein